MDTWIRSNKQIICFLIEDNRKVVLTYFFSFSFFFGEKNTVHAKSLASVQTSCLLTNNIVCKWTYIVLLYTYFSYFYFVEETTIEIQLNVKQIGPTLAYVTEISLFHIQLFCCNILKMFFSLKLFICCSVIGKVIGW